MIMAKKQYTVQTNEHHLEPIVSKDKYSVCKECKCQFEQEWNETTGKYSEWDLCPTCREKAQKPKKIVYKIDYMPYEYQRKMHDSTARFKLVAGGIRTGKDYSMTFELVKYAFECANENRPETMIPKVRCWIVAPSESIAKEDFVQLRRIIPAQLVADFNRSDNTMLTTTGILFEVKSAYNPESLVAVGLDAILISESARVKDLEDVWSNLEGRLISDGRGKNGKGGIALFNSSPLGKNYFYKMYQWGNPKNPDRDPQWESFRWQTWDNPEIAKKANEIQRNGLTYRQNLEKRMSSNRYRQDYLAEFLSDEYDVFPNYRDNTLELIPTELIGRERQDFIDEWQKPNQYMTYRMGYDPAGIKDSAPIVVVEEETGHVVYKEDLKSLGWDGQFDRIKVIQQRYNYARVKFSKTGHEIIPSQFDKRGILYDAYNEQGGNKGQFIENYALLVEQKYIRVLNDNSTLTERFIDEHENYVREIKGTKVGFSNGRGSPHDDFVSAMYMCMCDYQAIDEEETAPYIGLMEAL